MSSSPSSERREAIVRVRVLRSVRDRLTRVAALEDRPVAQIIRRALDAELERCERNARRRRGR